MKDLKNKIIDFAKKHDVFSTSELDNFFEGKYSRQYLSKFLNLLVKEEALLKTGTTKKSQYQLITSKDFFKKSISFRLKNENLEEFAVYEKIEQKSPWIKGPKENIGSIFSYAFSEMLNNAIEHSKSNLIDISITKTTNALIFIIRDFGIGVFNNIMQKKKLKSELEAIQELLKGKTTTAPKAHSGEGIFFTSKAADVFELESFGLRLRIDNNIKDVFIEEIKPEVKGTRVIFSISLSSTKHLSNIFGEYTDKKEFGFNKTEIKIKLYTMGTIYISRSQARRVLSGLEKFKTVIMDFDQVPTVGQAFADEIFRVFKIKYPNIKVIPINMNKTVEFMVGRVEKV